MPTYEYACKKCGEHLEAVQSFSDAPLTVCPQCGGELRKVFGNVGIVFKGSGFYKNDSRSSKSAKKDPAPKESSTTSAESSSSGSTPSDSSSSAPAGDKKSTENKSSSSDTKAPAAAS